VDDFSMVIKTQPNYGDAYYYRGNCWLIMGNKQRANGDFKKAADIYWQDGRLAEYKQTQAMILEVEIEQSLDILDF
jgi:tetratricopeptide (TPR) repeat protein